MTGKKMEPYRGTSLNRESREKSVFSLLQTRSYLPIREAKDEINDILDSFAE